LRQVRKLVSTGGKRHMFLSLRHCSEWPAWRLLDDQVHPPVFGIEDRVI
jgi:hypothetical protein